MRRDQLWISGAALAGILLTTTVTAQTPAPSPPPPQVEPRARPGRHPHMIAASRDLERAEKQLEKAVHHYDGHRAKAVELVKEAEKELQVGEHPEVLEQARS